MLTSSTVMAMVRFSHYHLVKNNSTTSNISTIVQVRETEIVRLTCSRYKSEVVT